MIRMRIRILILILTYLISCDTGKKISLSANTVLILLGMCSKTKHPDYLSSHFADFPYVITSIFVQSFVVLSFLITSDVKLFAILVPRPLAQFNDT
jgi:hypothetical protein